MTSKRNTERRTLETPPGLMESLKRLAQLDNRSINNLIVTVLQDYVTRRESAREDERQ